MKKLFNKRKECTFNNPKAIDSCSTMILRGDNTMMVVYFTVVGGLFYKIFIKLPYERKAVKHADELIIAEEKAGNVHA